MKKNDWIELSTDIFDEPKIKYIRRLPEGNNILLIWIILLFKAKNKGYIIFQHNVDRIYEALSSEFQFDKVIVELAMSAFIKLGMISIKGDDRECHMLIL